MLFFGSPALDCTLESRLISFKPPWEDTSELTARGWQGGLASTSSFGACYSMSEVKSVGKCRRVTNHFEGCGILPMAQWTEILSLEEITVDLEELKSNSSSTKRKSK